MAKSAFKRLVTHFFQGLLALLPLLVTGYLIYAVFLFVERKLDNFLILLPAQARDVPFVSLGVKAVLGIVFFFMIAIFGKSIRSIVGKAILKRIDSFFTGIPGINMIYRLIRQLIDIFLVNKDSFFMQPVLVEYPSEGIWAIAFDTGRVPGSGPNTAKRHMHTVFIPTTPNPTSGFLAMVPVEKMRILNMSVEDTVRMVLTGGIVKSGIDDLVISNAPFSSKTVSFTPASPSPPLDAGAEKQ